MSETTRLLSLGVASLMDAGIARAAPAPDPCDPRADRDAHGVEDTVLRPGPRRRRAASSAEMGFTIRVSPWERRSRTSACGGSRSASAADDSATATTDPYFDFTAPTDRRPFFFNMLKPRGFLLRQGPRAAGVVSGNLRATRTLLALAAVAGVLVLLIIGWPLLSTGRPPMANGVFAAALTYFAIIGFAFLLVQIPFLQRFSVYLGHPTYTFSIILFLMILSAGLGSVASERIDVDRSRTADVACRSGSARRCWSRRCFSSPPSS